MTATDCPWPAVQYNGHWTEALRLSQLTHGTETAAFNMAAPSVPLVPSLLDQAVEYEFGMGISSVTKSTGALQFSQSTAIARASGAPSRPPGTGADHRERSMEEQRVVGMKEASHRKNSCWTVHLSNRAVPMSTNLPSFLTKSPFLSCVWVHSLFRARVGEPYRPPNQPGR